MAHVDRSSPGAAPAVSAADVAIEPVHARPLIDRRVVAATVAGLLIVTGFGLGRLSAEPSTAEPSSALVQPSAPVMLASPGSQTLAPSGGPTDHLTPFEQPSILSIELETAYRLAATPGYWVACVAASEIACRPLPVVTLTAAEAREPVAAWRAVRPASLPRGTIIVAVPDRAIAFAAFSTLDPAVASTLEDAVVSATGTSFFFEGPLLAPGRYAMVVATAPGTPGTYRFEAAGFTVLQ